MDYGPISDLVLRRSTSPPPKQQRLYISLSKSVQQDTIPDFQTTRENSQQRLHFAQYRNECDEVEIILEQFASFVLTFFSLHHVVQPIIILRLCV